MAGEGISVPALPFGPEPSDQQARTRMVQQALEEISARLQQLGEADPVAAGLTLLSVQTVPSAVASVDFTAGIDATYEEYVFVLTDIVPATDLASLYLRTSTDGGTTFDAGATDYAYMFKTLTSSAIVSASTSTGAAQVLLNKTSLGSATNEFGWSGRIYLVNPAGVSYTRLHAHGLYTTGSGVPEAIDGGARRTAAASVDAVRFLFSTGDVESGTIRLYGVAKA